ncbi:MAG: hypothetical protein JSS71_10165 [Armatimonadetes bacterium]|nr:hypothetical protein [Armatimonadota bacterium]MBX3109369.1 hypothetical protein [Fimbriimonadaceae bacterium]
MIGRDRHWSRAIGQGWESVRATWLPMVVVQAGAAAVTAGYFCSAQVRSALVTLGEFREAGGLAAVFAMGFLAGSVVPEIAKALTGQSRFREPGWAGSVCFTGLVYAVVGGLVFGLYLILDAAFQGNRSPGATVAKVAIDMLVFSPFLSIPLATAMLYWWRHRAEPGLTKRILSPGFYAGQVLPGVVLCWAFWTPVLTAVYSLPLPLQFPVAMLCEAAWSIVFVFNVQAGQEPPVIAE